MKYPNTPPVNKRTRDFLACSAVSRPTVLPSAPQIWTQVLYLIIPSNLNIAQRYTQLHTAHTVQHKIMLNCRSLAPLSGSRSNCTADNGRTSSV